MVRIIYSDSPTNVADTKKSVGLTQKNATDKCQQLCPTISRNFTKSVAFE